MDKLSQLQMELKQARERAEHLASMVQEYQAVFENNCSVIAIFRVDKTSTVSLEQASCNWLKIFGCTKMDYGKSAQEILPRDILSSLPFQTVVATKQAAVINIPHAEKDTLCSYHQVKLIPIVEHDNVIKVVCYFPIKFESLLYQHDVTASAAEFDALFEATNNAIWVTLIQNGNFLTERCNKAFHTMFFQDTVYSSDEKKQAQLFQTLLPHFVEHFNALLQTAESQRFTLNITLRGFLRNIEIHLVPVINDNSITKIVGLAFDRTEEIDYLREVEYISQHDPLTGLYDRRYMDNRIARFSGKKAVGLFAAMFDLDGLKIVNDAFGHAAGDMHILAASQEISTVFSDCTVSRLGGDEFLVLGGGLDEAMVARRLSVFAHPFIIKGCPLPVSISAGYAFYKPEHQNLFQTIRAAEMKMYETKLQVVGSDRSGYLRVLRKVLAEKFPQQVPQTELMLSAASRLSDQLALSPHERENLFISIPLLNLGKLATHSSLLTKKQRTKRDVMNISSYDEMGAYIAKSAKQSEQVYDAIRYQHQRFDGVDTTAGMPCGLNIPLFGRLMAILLEYSSAAASGVPLFEITKRLQQLSGNVLDPQLVEEFLKIL